METKYYELIYDAHGNITAEIPIEEHALTLHYASYDKIIYILNRGTINQRMLFEGQILKSYVKFDVKDYPKKDLSSYEDYTPTPLDIYVPVNNIANPPQWNNNYEFPAQVPTHEDTPF